MMDAGYSFKINVPYCNRIVLMGIRYNYIQFPIFFFFCIPGVKLYLVDTSISHPRKNKMTQLII